MVVKVPPNVIEDALKQGPQAYTLAALDSSLDLPLDGLNIVVSPHVGSDTDMGKIGMQVMSAQAVVDYMRGIKPLSIVNKEVLSASVHRYLKDRTD